MQKCLKLSPHLVQITEWIQATVDIQSNTKCTTVGLILGYNYCNNQVYKTGVFVFPLISQVSQNLVDSNYGSM